MGMRAFYAMSGDVVSPPSRVPAVSYRLKISAQVCARPTSRDLQQCCEELKTKERTRERERPFFFLASTARLSMTAVAAKGIPSEKARRRANLLRVRIHEIAPKSLQIAILALQPCSFKYIQTQGN